jgi:hypothetical protein
MTIAITILLVMVIIAAWAARELAQESRRHALLSRQFTNMILYWEDHHYHPERHICKKHYEMHGENQPEGKCPECGINIRYDEKITFSFPTPPSISRRLKKYWEKSFVRPAMDRDFYSTPAVSEALYNPDPKKIFIMNVVYYDAEIVELNYRSVKKFLRDPFEYFVLDNTDEVGRSEGVRKYCEKEKINYVRLRPHTAWTRWKDGTSHAFGLDWGYHNIIMKYKPEIFGLIDGDLFLTKPISVKELMGTSDAWGIITDRLPFWHFWGLVYYIWPGFSFFRTERFANRTPNFLPTWGLDNGGKQPVDGPKVLALPEVYDLHSASWTEVLPGVYTRMYGSFSHFTAASWQPTGLVGQKKWMWSVLEDKTI